MKREENLHVLGLEGEVSQDEIKRAYFRMVRRHPPEKDPEMFQKIRSAYEELNRQDKSRDDLWYTKINNDAPQNSIAQWYLKNINDMYGKSNLEKAARIAEEAISLFGKYSCFVFPLAIAQRELGETGKAIKNFEYLVEKFPEEPMLLYNLGITQCMRGFINKACDTYEKCYSQGFRNTDFLQSYASCCLEKKNIKKTIALSQELLSLYREAGWQNPDEVLIECGRYLVAAVLSSVKELSLAKEEVIQAITAVRYRLEDHKGKLLDVVLAPTVVPGMMGNFDKKSPKVSFEMAYKVTRDLFDLAVQMLRNDAWQIILTQRVRGYALDYDKNLSEEFKSFAEVFYDDFGGESDDPSFLRFLLLELELCILEDWPERRKSAQEFEEKYPEAYEKIKPFIEIMEHRSNAEWTRTTLLQEYVRLEKYYEGTYFIKHPEYQRVQKQIWDSNANGPIHKKGKKIGRNDPCPCGSGKKYKKCCGRFE